MRTLSDPRVFGIAVLLATAVGLTRPSSGSGQPGPKTKNGNSAGDACCTVTAINAATGAITLKVVATGATCTVTASDRASLGHFAVGDRLSFQAQPSGATGNAASGTTSGGGSGCGSNVGRNADTRPKECIGTNSAGQQFKTVCPTGVPVKAATP